MRMVSVTEQLMANRSRNDLIGAITGGICAGLFESFTYGLYYDLTLWACTRRIVLGVATYFIVAAILQRFWSEHVVPSWLLTVFFGSVMFVAAPLAPALIRGWYDPQRMPQSLTAYLLRELGAARSVVIVMNFVTLPILAVFHYAHDIVKATKEWHAGSEPPHILGDE